MPDDRRLAELQAIRSEVRALRARLTRLLEQQSDADRRLAELTAEAIRLLTPSTPWAPLTADLDVDLIDDVAATLSEWLARSPRRRGRPRLESSGTAQGRVYAELARALLQSGQVSTTREAAVKLRMPAYDERHPELDGRAEESARRRLARYLQRFPEGEKN